MKKYKSAIILFAVFEIIAVSLWLATGSLFYLLNFTYIGTCIGVGLALSKGGWKYAREFIQFGVGAYMLVFLGLICKETCRLKAFGTICFPVWWARVCCTMPLPKSLDHCSLAEVGVATLAGQP